MAIPNVARTRRRPDPAQGEMLPPARDLASLLTEWRELAATVDVPAETLTAWYGVQCRALWDQAVKLWGAVERNHARLGGIEDPNWARWWRQEVRLEALCDALDQLRRKGHVLICPTHGVEGVDAGAVDVEALSLRGCLTGEGSTSWQRYCLTCRDSGLEQVAQRKHEAQSAPVDVNRLRRAGYRG